MTNIRTNVNLQQRMTTMVEAIKKGEEWIITEAIGEKNGGMRYIVRDIRGIQNGQNIIENMLVYTPDISPGWSDSETGRFCRRL